MRKRNWSAHSYKRKAGGVHTSPGQYRHQLPHEFEKRLDSIMHALPKSVRVVVPRGLGKASTTNRVLREIAPCATLYLLDKSSHRVVEARLAIQFVVDAFSRQVLGWKVIYQKKSIES